jgi:hypothetical protein
MRLQDVYYSINQEIFNFQYKHNGVIPDCIFVSEPLIEYISANEELMYNYDNKNTGIVGKFRGIDVRTYKYSEPQYYLAEGPGMFKRYCEDMEPVLYMED